MNSRLRIFIIWILSTIILFLFLINTNPERLNFSLSTVPIVLIWVNVFSFLRLISINTKLYEKSITKMLILVIPSFICLLLMLSAFGEIAKFEVVLIIGLALFGVFYFTRTWSK